jgi:hypothetical protein
LSSSPIRRARLPLEAVTATPASVSTKPAICAGVTLMRNRRKLARKITIGMPACSMATLIAVVCSSAE